MPTQTSMPTRKVIAGGATGAFVTLLVLILNTYVPLFQTKPITGEVASLATTVLGAMMAWIVPPAGDETTVVDGTGAVRTATK